MQVEKSAFISYRRTNVYIARAVYADLVAHGYDAFLDYESADAGAFAQVILHQIAARAHFILILTPSALEPCLEPDDWLRREIEHAVEQKRNIVPLMFEGFDFRDVARYLVGPLQVLPQYNGIRMPADFFEEAMTRLRERFLSKPLDVILHPVPESDETSVEEHIREADSAPPVLTEQIEAEEVFERGLVRFSRGKFDAAIEDYSEAIRLNPQFSEAYYRRGRARELKANLESKFYRLHSNLRQAAKSDYQQALRLSPDDARANTIRGALYYHDGDLDAAWLEVGEALRKNPRDEDAYFLRAGIHSDRREFDKAFEDFGEAARLSPNPFMSLLSRGWALVQRDRYDRAEEDFTRAIDLEPQSDIARVLRAISRLGQKDETGARDDLSEAVRLNPRSVFALYVRGVLHASGGDSDAAIRDFQSALEIDPSYEDARTAIRRTQVQKGVRWLASLFD
ncbi:MAG: tetratricopeptide repeat protein [Gammaproteobacteria bacterium]|nr:tetratricopeptide repeat protein [Gammaproteobacteria bacterium]NIR82397.1 tetratricopeptide repeat protein [Gammaproteobacteria bacterium]NIR91978.1 tetratricopeptide repeat protein [Gammaproteobacteria bacterium]NIU03534.1 tetratricopeptide repeat protein [Gammaproteobacteria bacterium]NIX84808.1 tetratricopeptide repeat protein [Gammaproteobacteria bacterium]